MRSIRSTSRARTGERGIILIAALTLAILYFALMELLLLDSSRALAEARNFRGRVVALTLCENAAELAARGMAHSLTANQRYVNDEGIMNGNLRRVIVNDTVSTFELTGEGTTRGLTTHKAKVSLKGRIENGVIKIEYADHRN
jgi:hypothetical protein